MKNTTNSTKPVEVKNKTEPVKKEKKKPEVDLDKKCAANSRKSQGLSEDQKADETVEVIAESDHIKEEQEELATETK